MILKTKPCATCGDGPQDKMGWSTKRKGILVKPSKLEKTPVQNMAPGGSKVKSK